MRRMLVSIIMLVFTGACQDDSYLPQSIRASDDAVALPSAIYGACDAYVVADREKGIDTYSDDGEKLSRPAVFKLKIADGVPSEVEILMLASNTDEEEPLYAHNSDPLNVGMAQQPDIVLLNGERTVHRYRGNSAGEEDSIELDWYAEADAAAGNQQAVERVVRVDFASDPYDNDEGTRRWGKHYVCHRNAGINALDAIIYADHITQDD